jgi:hypothetical protein
MTQCYIICILPVLFLYRCNCTSQCSITFQKTSVVSLWEPHISQWLQFYNCSIYFICKCCSFIFLCMTSYSTTCGFGNFTDMSALEIWILWSCIISPIPLLCLTELHPLLFHKHFGMEHLKFKYLQGLELDTVRYWPIQIKCLLRVLFCDTLCAVLILSNSLLEYVQH